ncbi:MAG: PolC-type DNA polymerase III [Eubacteriales bacterium]|nr:PolC-type DNA polymerase III [Eubacteriales bacterium]
MNLSDFLKDLGISSEILESQEFSALGCGQEAKISELRFLRGHGLGIVLAVEDLIPGTELLALEAMLENDLGIREVILGQKLPQDFGDFDLESLIPWILDHAKQNCNLETRLLSKGRLLKEEELKRFAWVLPKDCYSYFQKADGKDWLSNFWHHYGAKDLELEFLLDQQDQDFCPQTAMKTAGTKFLETAKIWAETLREREAQQAKAEEGEERGDAPLPDVPPPVPPADAIHIPKTPEEAAPTFVSTKASNNRFGRLRGWPMQKISGIGREGGNFRLHVTAHRIELRETRNQKFMVTTDLRDKTGAIACANFFKTKAKAEEFKAQLEGPLLVELRVKYDEKYEQDISGNITAISAGPEFPERLDDAERRRVELHCKSSMSAKDAIPKVSEIIEAAHKFKLPAVAITDRDVVQAFPEAAAAARKYAGTEQEIQIIYGLEAEVIDDGGAIAYALEDLSEFNLDRGFVAVDVETTGLDAHQDRVIELAAILYEPSGEGRQFVEKAKWTGLFNPGRSLPQEVADLTGINEFDLLGKPEFSTKVKDFHDFLDGRPLLGHNVLFDYGFIRMAAYLQDGHEARLKFNVPVIDTLAYARAALKNLRRFGLAYVAKELAVEQKSHHRAEDDARVSAEIFLKLWQGESVDSLGKLNQRYGQVPRSQLNSAKTYLVSLLARNELGLYNLYRLVSEAHLNFFDQRPKIPASVLQFLRSGLYLGSHLTEGEVFKAVLDLFKSYACNYELALNAMNENFAFRRLARNYDYLETQPPANYLNLTREENSPIRTATDIAALIRLYYELAKGAKIPLVACSNVHYIEPEDWQYRAVLMHDRKAESSFSDHYYLRSSTEMLKEFEFLGAEAAEELVYKNPALIQAACDPKLIPVPAGSYPPLIKEADDEVRNLCAQEIDRLYRKADGTIPEVVQKRLDKELNAIISNGYAVMYYIAHHLVKKSNEDGFVVGSRGSVGSSFVATLMNITEVNPLLPHYLCPKCKYFEADASGEYGSGYDLPPKNCPECNTPLGKDGQDIPFETFLGFAGNKQPDIDLNFSGLYQAEAHRFIEEMFGKNYSFRAGTISGYAEKNSRLIARNFLEAYGKRLGRAEINRLAEQVQGVKVTTGQHPGGIIVIPKDREIYDFTPIQRPANKAGEIITTHLDFNALHETILKLDILGHDDPTTLKLCQEMTGIEIKDIPVPDEKVMSLFQSTEALGIDPEESKIACATIGLPEVGTVMAREMAEDTGPKRFYDLVQLSGLAHGANVWQGNAKDLIKSGTCTLNEVIGCRDSIMTRLIYDGIEDKTAFDIMERVRKGRGLSPEQEELLANNPKIPAWYIDSCKKIKYMFPKAHAVAYTISALRIAWFKVYHPEAYYAASFSIRVGEFSAPNLLIPEAEIRAQRAEKRGQFYRLDELEPMGKKKFYLLELVEEMYDRGIEFAPISLSDSEAWRFTLSPEKKIIPPFSVIPNVSVAMGENIVKARQAAPFKNCEELKNRAGLGQVAMEQLAAFGVLEGLPNSAQVDFFGLI